jgi:hypothetical protein
MADITYTVNQDDPNSIQGFEQFSEADKNLIGTFEVNNLFDSSKNLAELHILSLSDTLLESHYSYSNYKQLGNAQSAGKSGASVVTIDPIEDSKLYGYQYGGIKLLYHFLNDPYTTKKERVPFYVESISPDRTEVRLQSLDLSNDDIRTYTQAIKDRLLSQSYFNEFRLNFDNNDLFIGINIDVVESNGDSYVAVKLYEPLPATYNLKSITYINEVISDSVAFEVDSLTTLETTTAPTLRSPNFNLEVSDQSVIPTRYYSYNDLFSYPVDNTNSQIFSLYSEKGAEISIDHTDYSDFIHFSSAYERLVNFKYKLQLIEGYSASLAQINTAASQSVGTTGSNAYYNNQIQGILGNFDHYERFLYYESSSYAWPKSNSVKPYINVKSSNNTAISWYANQLAVANGYDLSNGNILINSIPTFLRDDPNNENYLTFIYMIGQHFDNLWLYSKAVTDKYDADNRTDFGISKDLVAEALKNFGVKVYTSNKSIGDLFDSFIGQEYQSGSEVINHFITGSITGSNIPVVKVSYDDYNKEVQKRIYHNLSHLLKTKGTERGLRALINCFGISSDILKIKQYGGRNVNERPFFGDYESYTSSLDKIRLDNTGSIISGSTLSSYTSIIKREGTYTDDLHTIEVGFSPVDNIDNYIISNITASFNIDDYIGDPGDLTSGSYSGLSRIANTLLSGSLGTDSHYDLQDYVRLIKFYDNTIFKMIKDFIPARVVADTGVIIKPNLLNRSKAKSVTVTGSRPELSASIDTAFIGGNNAGAFNISTGQSNTAYSESIQTPDGLAINNFLHGQEQPKYNGEFSGSGITVTNGNLTANNPYTVAINGAYNFTNINYVSASTEVCLLAAIQPQVLYITSSTQQFNPDAFFNIGVISSGQFIFSASDDTTSPVYTQITFPHAFSGYPQYTNFYLWAQNPAVTSVECTQSIQLTFGTCSINVRSTAPNTVSNVYTQNLTTWFDIHPDQLTSVQYTASWVDNAGASNIQGIPNSGSYLFPSENGITVEIKVRDPKLGNICEATKIVFVGELPLGTVAPPNPLRGHEFKYTKVVQLFTNNGGGFGSTVCTQNYEIDINNPEAPPVFAGWSCPTANNYRLLGVNTSGLPNGSNVENDPDTNLGIPGYFTNQGQNTFPTTGLPGDTISSQIYYRVFEVFGSPNTSQAGIPYQVRYVKTTPYRSLAYLEYDPTDSPWPGDPVEPVRDFNNMSPYAGVVPPRQWLTYYAGSFELNDSTDFSNSNTQMLYYVIRNQKSPTYNSKTSLSFQSTQCFAIATNYIRTSTNTDLNYGKWPLTLYTALQETSQLLDMTTPTPTQVITQIPQNERVRAYIIQAYRPNPNALNDTTDPLTNPQYNGIMRQVVVYGEKGELSQVEGVGNNINYVDEYLKVGFNYSQGIPTVQAGSVTNQPTSIAPGETWVKFPRRYFT